MALRRTACTHLQWIILLLAWNIVSRRTFFTLLCGFLLSLGSRYLSIIAAFVLSSEDDEALYNFEHGMLNLPIDCKSMWMNVGYWNVSRSLYSYSIYRTDMICREQTNLTWLVRTY
jgi:hypothetical protein